MPPEITRLVNQFLRDPERIEVARPATTAKTITQSFRFCPDSEDWVKREMLRDMIRSENVKNAIIFCNRKRDVAILLKSLQKHGFNAGALHGDMDQKSRMETLDRFRNGDITVLAASDVAARGLDIPEVSHVFNFDLPWQSDDYVHRIGRTGRAGREGTAQSIVTVEDLKSFKDIEKMLGETAAWIGEAPTEQDFADAGKRKRGRGRGGRSGAERHGGRERNASSRNESTRPDGGRRQQPKGDRDDARAREETRAREDGGRNAEAKARPPRGDGREASRTEARRDGGRPQQQPTNGQRAQAKPEQPRSEPRPAKPAPRAPQPRGADAEPSKAAVSAFAGNIPAFMRRPARVVKAASE